MKIGIDLGGSHIAIGLVDDNFEITQKRTYYMSERKHGTVEEYIIDCIAKGINEILYNSSLKMKDIEQIGIAAPGSPRDGHIKNAVNLGIDDFNIAEELNKKLSKNEEIIIKVINDGKSAALAEKKIGSLKEFSDCVFLCIGTGIGGAAFINNEFLRPKRNAGFEFGHMVIKKDGESCNCGNRGCFEAYCSKGKFKSKMQEILNVPGYICAKELIAIIKNNISNKEVKELLEEYIDNLALGISNIINILEPEAISIGGSMSHYEELIFEGLKEKINNGTYLFNKQNPPQIFSAKAGNDAGIIGATLL